MLTASSPVSTAAATAAAARTAPPQSKAPAPPTVGKQAGALAVVIHPAPRQPQVATPPASGYLRTRPESPFSETEPPPSLRDRVRRGCCRGMLALGSGAFLGFAAGAFTALGLGLNGFDQNAIATRSAIVGGVVAAVATPLSWRLIGPWDMTCVSPPPEED